MKKDKRLIFCEAEGDFEYYQFRPSLIKLLYVDFEPMSIFRRLRLMYEWVKKGSYTVYYLAKNNTMVAHCVVCGGGGRRLKCTTAEDIVLGPYYVDSKERGQGYSELLIKYVLNHYPNYRFAYDYIKKKNIPSIRATLRCGFEKVGELNRVGLLHKLVEVKNGEFEIFRYSKR